MRVETKDVRLFVDVVGAKLRVRGDGAEEVPTIVFVHGGPAWDHLVLRTELAPLADDYQLVFYDHRGLGRSDASSPDRWTLSQWAADLHQLVTILGLRQPIVFGQSFGGMVVQRFALDYPDSYSALILSSTAARFNLPEVLDTFGELGGPELRALATSFYTAANAADRDRFLAEGLKHYTRSSTQIGALSSFKPDVLDHFFSDLGDGRRFDFRRELAQVSKPVLVLGGDCDPVISPRAVRELATCFPAGVARLEIFSECGHGPTRDQPEAALSVIRDFLHEVTFRAAGEPVA